MSAGGTGTQVEEPEVLPPEGQDSGVRARRTARRAARSFGPIAAALVIDGIDFMARGPLGLVFGMLVGGSVAYAIGSAFELPVWKRLLLALAAGTYCTLPVLKTVPLATILTAAFQFFQSDKKE